MRRVPYNALTGDADFSAIVPADRIYEASSLNTDPTKIPKITPPFVVIKFRTNTPELRGRALRQPLDIDIHDERGSFLRIDDLLKNHVRRLMIAAAGVALESGGYLMAVEWDGDSGDQYDIDFNTNYRTSSYTLVASQ